MKKPWALALCLGGCVGFAVFAGAQVSNSTVVFSEAGFPAADSADGSSVASLLVGVQTANAEQLPRALQSANTHLLLLPYGSAFPEAVWPDIQQYLQRGGNLLVIGGRPFTRSAYRDSSGWHLRDYSVRFARALMIDQYQTTPGSDGTTFQKNLGLPVQISGFAWKNAFSPIIRLSAVDLYHRGGAAGSIDARVDTIAWGVRNGRKLSAPVIEVDHLRNGFDGGRWVFVNADLAAGFFTGPDAGQNLQALAKRALLGSEEFSVRPVLPLYLPGEPIQLDVTWHTARNDPGSLTVKIATFPADRPAQRKETSASIPAGTRNDGATGAAGRISVFLPAAEGTGLYVIEAELLDGSVVLARYHSGFWIRDEDYLRSGPRLSVNANYLERDGKPFAVVGTTYMSSEAQRLYFEYPNVFLWNQEMGQIHGAGLNMIRSGWWTGWDKFCNENGEP
jgi:hypothetical protein